MTKLMPVNGWILVYPLIQDERETESGIILPEGMNSEIDVSFVRVTMLPGDNERYRVGDDKEGWVIEKDAILLIPKMEGLTLQLDDKHYKLVKMDRVVAFEEKKNGK